MTQLNLKAMAKINLGLDVIRKREDGYHQVRMIMQTIHLYDRISLTRTRDSEIKVKTNLFFLPTNESNLVYKAAKLLKDEFKIKDGVFIDLKKHIPVSAGLAGGSSDAAAILYGMNRIFQLGLSLKELMTRGVKIGADVPFCLMRGTALAEEIGEQLTPIKTPPKCQILIVKPPVSISTRSVYESLKLDHNVKHPDIDKLLLDIEQGDLKSMAADMGNVLESVTIANYPVIEQIKRKMLQLGALNAMMSGSGPTVFGLFDDIGKAKFAYAKIKEQEASKQVYLTELMNSRR